MQLWWFQQVIFELPHRHIVRAHSSHSFQAGALTISSGSIFQS